MNTCTWAGAASACLILFGLAACGGGGDEPTTASETPSAQTRAVAPPPSSTASGATAAPFAAAPPVNGPPAPGLHAAEAEASDPDEAIELLHGPDPAGREDAADAQARSELLAQSTRSGHHRAPFDWLDALLGRRLFEQERFAGNGRTCATCHERASGSVSPASARARFRRNPRDPLFLADGSDDGQGHGSSRMRRDATVLVRVPLADNVRLRHDPAARSVVLRRGIASTLNTPALDPVLMQDGRAPNLVEQARDAIAGHAQARRTPSARELRRIAEFQKTPRFFSSPALLRFAYTGQAPTLPEGRSEAEVRGRRFFIDAPPGPDFKTGLCAGCHSGAMLNETNEFLPVPPNARGGRFQSVGVSEFNAAGNPVLDFVFRRPDGSERIVSSPDPGRALVSGKVDDPEHLNAFKTPSLWGLERTAPYFHDNSARTLEDVAAHYARFFAAVSPIVLTEQEQRDMVAYMRLLR